MNHNYRAINASVDCRQLVAKYRPLVRRGPNLFMQCLWHDDSDPSMRVNAGYLWCFACGHKDWACGFLAKVEGITLSEAATKLAGIHLPPLPVIPIARSSTKQSPGKPTATAELTLAGFCARRKLDAAVLAEFGVRQVRFSGRPALQYATPMGIDRIKFLDGNAPKNVWAQKGGKPCWYGLDRIAAQIPENQSRWPRIYIVNGEPSVWQGAQNAIPAVCTLAGEGAVPAALILDLAARGVSCVRVVYDLDEAGARGADLMVKALRVAGIKDAAAITLPESLGPRGDFDDLCRRYGKDSVAVLEKDEFHSHRAVMNAMAVDNRLLGLIQSRDALRRRMDSRSHPVKGWEMLADREIEIRELGKAGRM
jgi:DNA primase